jgi:hypothetical protein
MIRGGLGRPLTATRLAILLAFLVALPACGVDFNGEPSGTELLRSVRIDGDRVAGSELTLTLGVTQAYPVPIRVGCYYEPKRPETTELKRFSIDERGTRVGETTLDASTVRAAGEKAPLEKLTFSFKAPAQGAYKLTCLTPSASTNKVEAYFTIAG